MKKEFVLKKVDGCLEDLRNPEIYIGDIETKNKILFLCYAESVSSAQMERLFETTRGLKKHFKEILLLENGIKPEVYEIQEKK